MVGIAPAPDGSVWVGIAVPGRGGGLQHLINDTLKPFLAPKLNGETLSVSEVRSDHQGNLWVGTIDHGLYKIHGTDVDHYGSGDGLSADFTGEIFEDHEGNIWVMTTEGLDMFRDLRVKRISAREGLSQDLVESVAAGRDGRVYIGTSRVQFLNQTKMIWETIGALKGEQITSLFVDDSGRLWAGVDNKLFVGEQRKFREITNHDGRSLGMIVGIAEDSDHDIWVETKEPPGTLIRIHDLKVQQTFSAPAAPLARRIVADPERGIWLGLVTGDLALFRDGQAQTFTFGKHPDSRVLAITAASDGSILGGTAFGVVAWKNGKQQILSMQNGLPCNYVSGLISDDAGNLWLYAQCGIIEIPREQMQLWWEHPESKLNLKVFDALDGFRTGSPHFNTSAKTPDGRLWFANGRVLQVVDPAHLSQNADPPPVHITTVVADRKEYSPDSAIKLPALTRDLEIDYTALDYGAPQKVLFRYMLEGRDAGFQEAGTRRQTFYNDLRPGHYRFRVLACNSDGAWNEAGASLEFAVLPALYQTNWFRGLCFFGFMALLWGIYQLRIQQLRRQFNISLDARLNERIRIARELHDTLLQSFQGLLLRFQASSNLLPTRPYDAKKRLDTAIDQASQAIAEGRDAVQGLRSSTSVTNDLAVTLRILGEDLLAGTRAPEFPLIDVAVEGEPRPLRPIVRDEVYRISAEGLRNAFRHARAKRIEIEICYEKNEFRVRIRDDGKGMDAGSAGTGAGHFGLSGMRERAQVIGANLEVWSNLDSGTELQLTMPAFAAYETPEAHRRYRFLRRAESRPS